MDDYDAPAMRFALDNEFEGGEFGADGEFYAFGQKKGKKQSKDRALYGVFHDSSEEDDDGFGSKRSKKKKDYSAPIGFVSGGFKGEEGKKKKKKRKGGDSDGEEEGEVTDEDEEEEDEDARPRFGAQRAKRTWDDPEDSDDDRVAQRDPDAELPSSFGATKSRPPKEGGWTSSKAGGAAGARGDDAKKETKVDMEAFNRLRTLDSGGKGLRMLQKMGYTGGGLGKEGQGIKTAIQAVKRADKEGLGTRPEPKQSLGLAEEEKKEKREADKKKDKAKRLNNWRVSIDERPRRARRVYKTAEEIREEVEEGALGAAPAQAQAPGHVAIVDMRGREARLVTGGQVLRVVATERNSVTDIVWEWLRLRL